MVGSIPKTMKAVYFVKYNTPYEIKELPVPEIGDNDLLLKMGAAGFCHTDRQVWEGVYGTECPIIPSHEPVGTVVKVGSKAQGKWKVGQRVGVLLFQHQCHACLSCEVTNDIRFCEKNGKAGLTHNGGMAEYMVADAESAVVLPDSVDFMQGAPLMCAGATVWAGILAAGIRPAEPVGIIGIGGLGSLAVQFAKALGHPVVAIDDRTEGLELAQEAGLKADLTVDFNDKDATEKIKKWAGKGGLPAIVCCTDDAPAIVWSTKALRTFGVLINLGLPATTIQFEPFDLVFQEKTIKGSLVATITQVEEMMKIVDKFSIRSHVTTVTMDEAPKLPDMYMDPHLKGRLVLKMD
ncbi:alcohol dehydrogenase GroES-like domain-containing protein [Aulographum hederae CBS 113979]|uniref:Alcohol dehydrogenase GroES-like domain-containing protein n=1 Tax=Aulographum hederae CBS 113979 TaxID=1176131 RepID=A0A6G1H2L8_9PEZI|nr:alcohol dehydrogenase GroES-like domain-containing protein [Aulographum hederae CBS 113979]